LKNDQRTKAELETDVEPNINLCLIRSNS